MKSTAEAVGFEASASVGVRPFKSRSSLFHWCKSPALPTQSAWRAAGRAPTERQLVRVEGCLAGGSPPGIRQVPHPGSAVNDCLYGTGPGTGLNPAASVQVAPAPPPGGAAVSLPAEPEPIPATLLLEEQLEHAGPALGRPARRPAPATAFRSLTSREATVSRSAGWAWAAGSRPAARRPAPGRPLPAASPAGGPRRTVRRGGVDGCPAGQRGACSRRRPPAA